MYDSGTGIWNIISNEYYMVFKIIDLFQELGSAWIVDMTQNGIFDFGFAWIYRLTLKADIWS